MIWLAALLAALVIAPFVVNDYLLTVLILILYFAYTGQAWNIMMGFAGQLSLGHAIYVGLGAYIAALLFTRYGIVPWLGLLAAMPVAAACGAVIGFLAFRFGVAGVYFAILTIAFAEFARIGFDHLDIVNASAGLFLPVAQYAHNDLWRLRGNPAMFYYVILAATVAAFILCRVLLHEPHRLFLARHPRGRGSRARRRHRYLPLQNVRGDDLGRRDVVRRRVLRVFLQQSVPRDRCSTFRSRSRSFSGPIIGGIGTLFGPILGAFVLTGLAESLNSALTALGIDLPGAKQVFYGICLLVVVVALPEGMWPWLARRLGVEERRDDRAALAQRGQQAFPRSGRRRPCQLRRRRRRAVRGDRSERRRQDHAVQHDRRRDGAGRRHASSLPASRSTA